MIEALRKKENYRDTKRHSDLFYKSAYRLMSIDYEKQNILVSRALMAEIPEDEEDEEIKILMRMHPIQPTCFNSEVKDKHKG